MNPLFMRFFLVVAIALAASSMFKARANADASALPAVGAQSWAFNMPSALRVSGNT